MSQSISPKLQPGIDFIGIATCFICHDGKGKIFMAKRSGLSRDEHGRWDIGGGILEKGVSAENNAIREIQEEYSAQPIDIQFLGYRDVFRRSPDGKSTHWLALDYLAQVNPDDVSINEPHKFDDSGWFNLDQLPQPLHSQLGIFFDQHSDALRLSITNHS